MTFQGQILCVSKSNLKLQEVVAQMTGKEKALYVSSGTQSNLCGLLSTCWERGSEIFIGDKSHIALYEQGSVLKTLWTLDFGDTQASLPYLVTG